MDETRWYLDRSGRRKDALTHRPIRREVVGVEVIHPKIARDHGLDRMTPVAESPVTADPMGPSREAVGTVTGSPSERPSTAVHPPHTGTATGDGATVDGPRETVYDEPSGAVVVHGSHDEHCPDRTSEKTCGCGRTYHEVTEEEVMLLGGLFDHGLSILVGAVLDGPAVPLGVMESKHLQEKLKMPAAEADRLQARYYASFGAMLRKHGGGTGKYGPELGLAFALLGVVGAKAKVIDQMRKDGELPPKKPKPPKTPPVMA